MGRKIFLYLLLLIQFSLISQTENNLEVPKEGIYKSFEEYKLGTPSRKTPFEIKTKERKQGVWEGTTAYYPIREDNGQLMDRLWGFSDGEIFYIKYGLEFFPVEYKDGKLSFWAYGDFFDDDTIPVMLLLGGIGVVKEFEEWKKERVEYMIDINTGKVRKKIPNHPDAITELIFYRKSKKESKDSVSIKVGENEIGSIAPNSIKEIEYLEKIESLRVCYGDDLDSCEDFVIELGQVNYFKCISLLDSNGLKILQVENEEGVFDYAVLKNLEKKRKKRKKLKKKN